jgi:hypothetical protein
MPRRSSRFSDLTDQERLWALQEGTVPLLVRFKVWLDNGVHSVLPQDSLRDAVHQDLSSGAR